MAVILLVEVNVINHQLTHDLDLLSLKSIDSVEGPLCVTSIRGHFGDNTAFFQCSERGITRLWMSGPSVRGKGWVETEAEVIVESVGGRELAVTGFAVGWGRGCTLARVFREIEVGDDGVDVALSDVGESVCEGGMIGASKRFWEL